MPQRMAAALLVLFGTVAAAGCRESSTGPGLNTGTEHHSAIETNETWTAAASPHTVHGRLPVGGAPGGPTVTLTIEAGATVLFGDSAALIFGATGAGSLRAEGTVSAPITLRSVDSVPSPGRWIGVTFRSADQSTMRHVTVSGCGQRRDDGEPRGCLVLGHPVGGPDPTLLLDTVLVEDGSGGAVILHHRSRFAPGSAALSVRNMHGHIATIPAGAVPSFPLGGAFTGNDSAQVRVSADTLRESATWPTDHSWVVIDPVFIEGPGSPVLTIPPGSRLRMVGSFEVGKNAPGGLRIGADGGSSVVLWALDSTWGGLDFLANAVSSSISNTELDNAGGYTDGRPGAGAVHIMGSYPAGTPAPSPVLRNVSIRSPVGTGVALSYGGSFGTGSTGLTISGANGTGAWDGTPIFVQRAPLSFIPAGNYTANRWDVILAYELEIRQDETWRKSPIPYFIFGGVSVGDSSNHPTLSIEPGADVAFSSGVKFMVGWNAPGAVHAAGTAAEPITFRGAADVPGAWVGIYIGTHADSSSLFDHVIVAGAGEPDPWVSGAFHFYTDVGPILTNSTVRHSAGCGIMRLGIAGQPPWSTDFTAATLGNTFADNAGAPQCGP